MKCPYHDKKLIKAITDNPNVISFELRCGCGAVFRKGKVGK
jgi:hypothetical protein